MGTDGLQMLQIMSFDSKRPVPSICQRLSSRVCSFSSLTFFSLPTTQFFSPSLSALRFLLFSLFFFPFFTQSMSTCLSDDDDPTGDYEDDSLDKLDSVSQRPSSSVPSSGFKILQANPSQISVPSGLSFNAIMGLTHDE